MSQQIHLLPRIVSEASQLTRQPAKEKPRQLTDQLRLLDCWTHICHQLENPNCQTKLSTKLIQIEFPLKTQSPNESMKGGLFICVFFCFRGRSCFFGFLVLCFPASLLFCFFASLLFAFSASLLVYFSAFLLLLFCFSAFLPFLLFAFPASLLYLLLFFSASLLSLLLCFSAFVLLCLSTSTILRFSFLRSCVLLLYFLLLCFSASCLYYLFVFFIFFCFILSCLYPK